MAWEWVAPVAAAATGTAGAFFTWLAGAQGRRHAERLYAAGREAEHQAALTQERRDAYVASLRVIELDRRRLRYKREGELEKLHEVDSHWPKGRRVDMTMDAIIAVQLFGSDEVRGLIDEWRDAVESGDESALDLTVGRIQEQIRAELNDPSPAPPPVNARGAGVGR